MARRCNERQARFKDGEIQSRATGVTLGRNVGNPHPERPTCRIAGREAGMLKLHIWLMTGTAKEKQSDKLGGFFV